MAPQVVDGAVVDYAVLAGGVRLREGTLACGLISTPFEGERVDCEDAANAAAIAPSVILYRVTDPNSPPTIYTSAQFEPGNQPDEIQFEFLDGSTVTLAIEWGPNDDENCFQPCLQSYTTSVAMTDP